MNIIVTGLPRTRSSIIVNEISNNFSLKKPNNIWGETFKYDENLSNWLKEKNCIFKMWSIHSPNYLSILENYEGNIIVSYTQDFYLFVIKLLRSDVLNEWGLDINRKKQKIKFFQNLENLEKIKPQIISLYENLTALFSNKNILLKSAYINNDKISIHVDSNFPSSVAEVLKNIVCSYKVNSISDYVEENSDDVYEYLFKKFKY